MAVPCPPNSHEHKEPFWYSGFGKCELVSYPHAGKIATSVMKRNIVVWITFIIAGSGCCNN